MTALVSRPLALLLLVLGLAVSGCSGDRGTADDAPGGRSALRRLLQQHELRLVHRVVPIERLDENTRALIVTVPLTDAQWGRISAWVEGGRTVIVAHDGTPAERLGLHARSGRSHELRVDHRWHHQFGDVLPRLPGRRCLDPGKDTPLIADEHACAYLTLREAGKGWWIFAADDQLFSNAALAFGDNAALLLDLCQNLGAKEIELVDETTGVAATSPVGSLLAGGLGAVLLQLGLVALLLCAHRGVAFGTRMDPPTRQRREFAEHVRAIGMQYWKARAYRYALAVYGAWAVERLRARVHTPAGDVARLVAALAVRSGEPAEHIRQLLAAVATARQDVDGSAYGGERATMTALFRSCTRLEVTGEHPGLRDSHCRNP